MRAALLALVLSCSPAFAVDLVGGDELAELRYACFGDDAEVMTGSRKASNDACKQWDELIVQAKNAGYCVNDTNDGWDRCS